MKNIVPAKDAVGDMVYIDSDMKVHKKKLFEVNEIERAEAITNALKGLSIESAQELLKKVEKYLLQTLLTE